MFKLNVLPVFKSSIFASPASEKFFLPVAWGQLLLILTYSCEMLLYGHAGIAFFKTLQDF